MKYIGWFIIGIILFILMLLSVTEKNVYGYEYTPSDVVLIGKIVEHEAPHESELGKRLVIDTILNRVESDRFPNTVYDVINQPGQYCNPKKYPQDGIYKLIAEEIYFRTNSEVLWYRTKRYHTYGTPLLFEGAHYFSDGI